MTRVRGRLLAAAIAVYAAWSGFQTWLAYRGVKGFDAFNRTQAVRFHELEAKRAAAGLPAMSSPIHNPIPIPTSRWIHSGVESAVAMALVLALGTALVLGGRRWWSLIVALIPAVVIVGKFQDGYSVGQGWTFTLTHYEGRLAAGVLVDALTIAAIVALLIKALPRDAAPVSAPTALLRGTLPAVVLFGWWLIQNPVDADASRKVWVAQAVVWVLALALLASSSLLLVPKVLVTLVIAPYMSVTMLDDLVGGYGNSIDTTQFVHHMLVASGVMAWVVALPALVKTQDQLTSCQGSASIPARSRRNSLPS
jgi:hypothetical protein